MTEDSPSLAVKNGPVFLGPSSAAAFMQEVQTSAGRKRGHAESVGDNDGGSDIFPISRSKRLENRQNIQAFMEELVLPPRRIADIYLDNYWAYVYPLYPILHKQSFMKRILSMTFGRPPMLAWSSMIPFPMSIDDEQLSMEPSSSSNPLETREKSRISFFINAIKLSDILMDVLKYFYAPRSLKPVSVPGGFRSMDLTPLLEFEDAIECWKAALPTYLQYHPEMMNVDYNSPFRSEAVILHYRYLHIKILLFRPIVVDLAQSQFFNSTTSRTQTTLKHAIAASCVRSCVAAAQETIDILVKGCGRGHLPVFWHSVFNLYTAGTVVLAVLLTPSLRKSEYDNLSSLEQSFARCLECLSYFVNLEGAFAKRCLMALKAARDGANSNSASSIRNNDNLELNLPDLSATVSQDEISGSYRDLQGLDSESNHHEQLENNFVESWWPVGGLDWLNSVPVDFNDNLPNINSHYASAGQAGPSIPDSGVGTDPRRVASPVLSL
ncbi:hypothetical protein BS50DRAFT_632282 [Corynespora cassiicola Philippines]|uniref:Transcription factor domain-containing protein n=1 Tax=Corynespora cassiicola Philippines TaxID=1448308 RepID=A0A2T2NY92_CORCC|nr:hypothetical protein BS50DRAFT_632282 [Corynespora cassiicola Philippines]